MADKLFKGAGGGPDQPVNTSDNLKSEDVVEFALALSEGPIRGLTGGASSFYVGETPLVGANGVRNFDKFAIGVHPGYPEGSASPLELKLGGATSNSQVGLALLQNTSVVRQTDTSLRGTIDEIEVRILFARLLLANEEGTFYNNAHFTLEYKKVNELAWTSFQSEIGDGGNVELKLYGESGGDNDYEDIFLGYVVDENASVTKGQVIGTLKRKRYEEEITEIKAPATGVITGLTFPENTVIPPYTGTVIASVALSGAAPNGELVINGKTTTGYVKEFRALVPRIEDDDWMIRIVKLSPDNDPSNVVDMTWESFQCTNREPITYPNVAIVHGIGVANGQFSSIPEFSGVYDGLIIRVPTNYNPDLRTYDESTPWDGSFKFAWTNNPAWILYDLITNTRYGLAKHRRYIDANRYAFYEAAKWCDMPVIVGEGPATRPRYTYNDVITDQRPASEMLNYVAGSFNALIWDDLQGQIHLRVDKDDPAVQLFTTENVTEEGFAYTFTDITTRANDVSVSFINPDLDWVEDRRRIPNVTTSEENIEKFGRIPLDFIAVGCTDVHEAIAKAQVRLLSALTETIMVSFTTTRQGSLLSLYDVILIADPIMGWSLSGRLERYDASFIYLRDPFYIETIKHYTIKIQTQTGLIVTTVQPEEIGHVTRLRISGTALPTNLPRHAVFTLEETGGFGLAKPFRVLGLEEVDGSPYLYRVFAMEVNRNKYVLSENGTPIDEPVYNFTQPPLPGQPSNFRASSGDEHLLVMPTGEVISRIFCSWRKPFAAIVKIYELQYKLRTDDAWQSIKTNLTEQYISPVTPGAHYSLRVASIDPDDRRSPWTTILDHQVIGKQIIPANVVTFTAVGDVFQILLNWTYSLAPDIKKVEIWASTLNELSSATKLTDLAYPTTQWTHLGLNIGVTIYYWIRVQDTSGNYSNFSSPARQATTVTDATRILEILEGQINEFQLVDELNQRIDLVDGPTSLTGSVAAQVKAEQDARVQALLDEQGARAAAIASETTARVSGDQALAQSITTIGTRLGSAESSIASEAQTRATQDTALAFSITQLNTSLGQTNAAISNEAAVRSQADSAQASSVSTLTTTVNGFSASIQSVTTSVNGLKAEQYIKTDVNGFVSGYGLASAAQSSLFIVRATNFAFALPGQTTKYPFMAGVVNGVQTIGINGALVIDGSITVREANIVNANITRLKIAGNSVTIPQFSQGGAASCGSFTRPNTSPSSAPACNSITFFLPEACNVLVLATVGLSNSALNTGTVTQWVELYVDNVSRVVHGGYWWQESVSIGYGIFLGAGTHTAIIGTAGNPGASVDGSTLWVLGAMR